MRLLECLEAVEVLSLARNNRASCPVLSTNHSFGTRIQLEAVSMQLGSRTSQTLACIEISSQLRPEQIGGIPNQNNLNAGTVCATCDFSAAYFAKN